MILEENNTHYFDKEDIVNLLKNTENLSVDKHLSNTKDVQYLLNKNRKWLLDNTKSIVIMSCESPTMDGLPEEIKSNYDNEAALDDFLKYLRNNHRKYLKTIGHFEGEEHSFIIKNMTIKDAKKMCARYYQQSFLYGYKDKDDNILIIDYYESDGFEDGKVKPYSNKGTDIPRNRTIEPKEDSELTDYYTDIGNYNYSSDFGDLFESIFERVYKKSIRV